MDEAPALLPQLIAAMVACIAPLMFGFAMGYSSPANPELEKIQSEGGLHISVEESSWFSSLIAIGALLGGPIAALIVDRFGRKLTIMLCCLPFAIGWFLIIFADDILLLYIGRILTGIGTGMSSLAVPTYIAEISVKQLRGTLGAGFQLSITIGVLIMFAFGLLVHYTWLAVIASTFAAILVCGMLKLPESPSWLLRHHKRNEAVESLRWLRGNTFAGIDSECVEIEENLLSLGSSIKFTEIFYSPSVYKPLLLILGAMVFQQFSGINAVIFNSESIFKGAGFVGLGGVAAIILAVVQVVMTFVSCVIMDKVGRKTLLIISGSFMTLSCITFSLYYLLVEKHIAKADIWYMQTLSLGSLGLYISMFSIGWGPIPWLFMSEVLPGKARGVCSGIATATNWTCAFIVTRFFGNLQHAIKPYGAFFLFAGINLLGIVFVIFGLIETKGKSLEEIERYIHDGQEEYQPINNDDTNEAEDTG